MTPVLPVALLPIGVRGMKVLNRQKFLRNVVVPILKVSDEKVSKVTPICKNYLLKLDSFKPVQTLKPNSENSHKIIHLNPEKISQWMDFQDSEREILQKCGITEKDFDSKEIQITYENFKYDAIFKAVLPENEDTVSGFSQIGHIIHLNLRDHLLDYKQLIGEVLIDKIKTCSTVVNKNNIIDNTYRNFSMEIIAGEENYIVSVKENNCNFRFDFSKVYWNPRLSKEHERILEYLKPGDVLFDVFCGVGPFSIPAAKRKCKVFANDLNPDSFTWLKFNAKQNKVDTKLFKSYNMDGKDFICKTFKDFVIELCKGEVQKEFKIHVTMNLPAMAVEFLKHFKGLLEDKSLMEKFHYEIIVYVYCFVIGDDPYKNAEELVKENIGCQIDNLHIFYVRNVSPKKEMMRVKFNLTKSIIFGEIQELECEPPQKKICIEKDITD
ncbi:PREDICTED: tRNA (guanine(37)-N1)-methyltransferase [Papilio polytes]|uniref:tRNA (guanine(37)-N1)-methyltransferase n=1 Tax=Papilio polytes TaxID=76194 RepID=UPI000675F96D|nr:PREDICTED: tRNA (guanine(37)-N1)-methyltransferase [Papilio polytes]